MRRDCYCGDAWSSLLLEGMKISSLQEEPTAVEPEGPRERGRRPQDPEEDPVPPPIGAENPNFIVTGGGRGGARRSEELEVWMCM